MWRIVQTSESMFLVYKQDEDPQIKKDAYALTKLPGIIRVNCYGKGLGRDYGYTINNGKKTIAVYHDPEKDEWFKGARKKLCKFEELVK